MLFRASDHHHVGDGDVVKLAEQEDIRDKVKIMIGGAVITQDYADEIGADGYSKDAAGAVKLAKQLLDIENE